MSQKRKTSSVAMRNGGVSVRFRLAEDTPEARQVDLRQAGADLRYLSEQVTMWATLHEGPVDPAEPVDRVMREIEVIADAIDAATAVIEDLPFGMVAHLVAIHHAVAAARQAVAS